MQLPPTWLGSTPRHVQARNFSSRAPKQACPPRKAWRISHAIPELELCRRLGSASNMSTHVPSSVTRSKRCNWPGRCPCPRRKTCRRSLSWAAISRSLCTTKPLGLIAQPICDRLVASTQWHLSARFDSPRVMAHVLPWTTSPRHVPDCQAMVCFQSSAKAVS